MSCKHFKKDYCFKGLFSYVRNNNSCSNCDIFKREFIKKRKALQKIINSKQCSASFIDNKLKLSFVDGSSFICSGPLTDGLTIKIKNGLLF